LRHLEQKGETKGLEADYDKQKPKDGWVGNLEQLEVGKHVLVDENSKEHTANKDAATGNEHSEIIAKHVA
jgi:hypothetical protein